MLSTGAKICLHIDYEYCLEEGMTHPAAVRYLVKDWKLTPAEVEDVIKEQEEFLNTWGKGVIA